MENKYFRIGVIESGVVLCCDSIFPFSAGLIRSSFKATVPPLFDNPGRRCLLSVCGYICVIDSHFLLVSFHPCPISTAAWGLHVESVTFHTPRQVQEEWMKEVLQYNDGQDMVHVVPTVRGVWSQTTRVWESEGRAVQVLN